MKVTPQMLKRLGACADQYDKFVALFPKGVDITEVLCVEHAADFNWDWVAHRLLPVPARAEYDRITVPARAEYDRITVPALAEYDRVRAPARAEYERAMASAFGRLAQGEPDAR